MTVVLMDTTEDNASDSWPFEITQQNRLQQFVWLSVVSAVALELVYKNIQNAVELRHRHSI